MLSLACTQMYNTVLSLVSTHGHLNITRKFWPATTVAPWNAVHGCDLEMASWVSSEISWGKVAMLTNEGVVVLVQRSWGHQIPDIGHSWDEPERAPHKWYIYVWIVYYYYGTSVMQNIFPAWFYGHKREIYCCILMPEPMGRMYAVLI